MSKVSKRRTNEAHSTDKTAVTSTTPDEGTKRESAPGWFGGWIAAWDRFWFSTSAPHTLAVIRIGCGLMMVYIHVIWASLLTDFMGPSAWLDNETIRYLHEGQDWGWSWLWYVESPALLWIHQIVAIVVALCMALGFLTRMSVALSWWLMLMVCHRMTLALFGLDQIVIMLSMYLMICRPGSVWSVDAWLARRRTEENWLLPSAKPAVSNNIATRLIQLHLCIIYLFGGLSKMRGEMWFDGSALWYTVVNYEYQSMDLTWLGRWPLLVATLTAATIFWETFYCALVWPRLTRPLALGMAVMVHGGIAIGLGMVTFGSIMLLANVAFIYPETIASCMQRLGLHRE